MNSEAPEPIAKDAAPAVGVTPIAKLAEPHRWLGVVALVAAAGAIGSGMLWQKLGHVQEQLARQTADSGAQAGEARSTAKQAQELAIETAAKIAVLDARLSEVTLQRTQLEELMQSLSRSRDENLVVDMESSLRLAQQQAQLTGSVEPLLTALKSAEQRVNRAAQPRLAPIQRAIAKDIARIKNTALVRHPSHAAQAGRVGVFGGRDSGQQCAALVPKLRRFWNVRPKSLCRGGGGVSVS